MADKTVASLTSSTPTIDDLTISYDNADTSELKKTTWQAVRDLFKTYFDTVYQAILVSGTNIKTVNGNSLLGSGNITISGGGSVATDTIWDAKGDLAVGTGADTASRLAVGTNGQVLVADSTQATGVKWENASGTGDMLASTYDPAGIAQQVVGTTATQTFSIGVKTFLAGMLGLRNVANTFTSFFTNTATASRTWTLPDANTIVPIISQLLTFSGPTASRTITIPDADFTVARTDAANTFTGVQTMTSPNLTTPVLGTPSSGILTNTTGYQEIKLARILPSTATDGATVTFDLSTNNKFQVTIAGNRALALSNTTNIPAFMINIKQDATGSRVPTWFSGITWAGGSAPTLTTTANKTDSFGFQQISAGVYLGFVIAQNI